MGRKKSNKFIVRSDGKKSLRGFNIQIGEMRTSVRLSPEAYRAIEKIAEVENCDLSKVFSYIYLTKDEGISTSTAIRDFAFKYFMDAATEEGHFKAGHGKLIRDQNKIRKIDESSAHQ